MRGDVLRQRKGRGRFPFEFGIPLGALAMVITAVLDSAAVASRHQTVRLAVMAAAVAVFCALAADWRTGLATAVVGYLLLNGFLLNRYGELSWGQASGPHASVAIAGAAAAGLLVGRRRRSIDRHRAPAIGKAIDIDINKETRDG